ncbi:unnamed protein product [Linum tenue]|uniref:Uncharacterized protein n=1 Tax=Linum tenue TaxID=586396 RepID=A0AAV0JYS1_9ROSI|nr:unnamed protein product [Linum tenue]
MSIKLNLSPFKLDIDELINEFVEHQSTSFPDWKKIWGLRKFSYIYEAAPTTHLGFFMQSLYAHTIGHMNDSASFPRKLGGLYCLYCLYETQPFKPPFKIYLSLGELKTLKNLVAEAKGNTVKAAPALMQRMLEKDVFLFGFLDLEEAAKTVEKLAEQDNEIVKCAAKKLFKDTRMEHFLHLDMGRELGLEELKKLSTEYAESKQRAIEEARKVVNVQDVEHLANAKELVGDKVEKAVESWDAQKDEFYHKTGVRPTQEQAQQEDDSDNSDAEYTHELERELQLFDENLDEQQ